MESLSNIEEPSRKAQETEQSPELGLRDFFNMASGERQELVNIIGANGGVVRIFVHPFFRSNIPEFEKMPVICIDRENNEAVIPNKVIPGDLDGEQLVELGVKRIMSNNLVPVIFLEEESSIEELKRRLVSLAGESCSGYIVPTLESRISPMISEDIRNEMEKKYREQYENLDNVWLFILALEELGVKKVMLGGQELFLMPNAKKETIDLDGCVGKIAKYLMAKFKVEFSFFANPHSARNLPDVTAWMNRQISKAGYRENSEQ